MSGIQLKKKKITWDAKKQENITHIKEREKRKKLINRNRPRNDKLIQLVENSTSHVFKKMEEN